MARYITAVDVELRHPETDELIKVLPWSDCCRLLFRDPRIIQGVDILALLDLRRKLISMKTPEVGEISDDDWSALLPVVKRPGSFSPDFIYCAEAFFRAFLDAPAKKPELADAPQLPAPPVT